MCITLFGGPLIYFLGARPPRYLADRRADVITLEIFHPRFTRHGLGYLPGTFMPAAYKKNQKELLAKVKEQYDGPPLKALCASRWSCTAREGLTSTMWSERSSTRSTRSSGWTTGSALSPSYRSADQVQERAQHLECQDEEIGTEEELPF